MMKQSNLSNKRPHLSQQEATQVAEAILPTYLATYFSPHCENDDFSDTATIRYERTVGYTNCWVLNWVNKRYEEARKREIREIKDIIVGGLPGGYIFVDRWTGYVRVYDYGRKLEDLLYDYNQDALAAGRAWVLLVSFAPAERTAILARLKTVLGLTFEEVGKLKERLPGPLFAGNRATLDWLAGKLSIEDIPCTVGLEEPDVAATVEWVDIGWWGESQIRGYSRPVALALKDSRKAFRLHGGRNFFREFACPLPEIVARYGIPPKRAFQRTEDEERECRIKLFELAALVGHADSLRDFFCYGNFEKEANRRIPGSNGDTALLIAARNDYRDAVQVLLMYGADKNLTDAEGRTALEIAEANGFQEIVDLIVNGR